MKVGRLRNVPVIVYLGSRTARTQTLVLDSGVLTPASGWLCAFSICSWPAGRWQSCSLGPAAAPRLVLFRQKPPPLGELAATVRAEARSRRETQDWQSQDDPYLYSP